MFSRKKPPQLSVLEELQQTYNDCCNLTIQNLTLEEDNKLDQALKGWKSLHTSLLYKTHNFEQQSAKFDLEQKRLLQELRDIRDQNVRHLIRVQMRIDEEERRKMQSYQQLHLVLQLKPASVGGAGGSAQSHLAAYPKRPSPTTSLINNGSYNSNYTNGNTTGTANGSSAGGSSGSFGSKMSVPSLRTSGAPSSRALSANPQQRHMLKTLRPGMSSLSTSSVDTTSAAAAASLSWRAPLATSQPPAAVAQAPAPAAAPATSQQVPTATYSNTPAYAAPQQRRNASNPSINPPHIDAEFADFDLDQWERVTRLPTPDLIDLERDLHGLGIKNTGYKSMEDLISRSEPPDSLLAPPPPPPPRRSSPLQAPKRPSPPVQAQSSSSSYTGSGLSAPKLNHASKSNPDIRTTSTAGEPKRYVYNKPKPFNVSEIMKNQAKKKAAAAASSTTTTAAKKAVVSKAKSPPSTSTGKGGPVAYKPTTIPKIYLKKGQANGNNPASIRTQAQATSKKKAASKNDEVNSPTMDDILGGYANEQQAGSNKKGEEEIEKLKGNAKTSSGMSDEEEDELIASIRGIDVAAAKQILNDIVVHGDEVYWDDIAGLESAKNSLKEAVVYPFLRPDLFSGLREPARGLLLFGPPGTGKTMLARAVATESKSTFFSISASSLTSKYLGESEKLVKALFLLARKLSPSIVFVDEIDSLLSTRTEGEVDSSRRIKNEFLIQWSELSSAAAGRDKDDGDVSRVLILGATNVPWAIDEAARRRFVRRQYIPLPENETRRVHIQHLLGRQKHTLSEEDFDELIKLTQGFSGSDMTALAKDAAMGPLRSLGDLILDTPRDQIRPVSLQDFISSLQYIRPSVLVEGLSQHEEWAALYGSYGG